MMCGPHLRGTCEFILLIAPFMSFFDIRKKQILAGRIIFSAIVIENSLSGVLLFGM
jgi:hypothetical protein